MTVIDLLIVFSKIITQKNDHNSKNKIGVDSVEKIIESFSLSTFPKQHEEPNYDKIQTIHNLSATDAASIETTRGGGQYGYLAIVMLTKSACHNLTVGNFIPQPI